MAYKLMMWQTELLLLVMSTKLQSQTMPLSKPFWGFWAVQLPSPLQGSMLNSQSDLPSFFAIRLRALTDQRTRRNLSRAHFRKNNAAMSSQVVKGSIHSRRWRGWASATKKVLENKRRRRVRGAAIAGALRRSASAWRDLRVVGCFREGHFVCVGSRCGSWHVARIDCSEIRIASRRGEVGNLEFSYVAFM